MSLYERLRRIEDRARRRRPEDDVAAALEREAPLHAFASDDEGVARPTSIEHDTVDGVTLRRSTFALDATHGRHRLGDALACDPVRLAAAARIGGRLDVADAVFLDTETTDLGSGAGVYVFLVGLLYLDGRNATVEQWLLEGPEHEPAFLERVDRSLTSRGHLVTFFGKSFDRHRLDDRFDLNFRRRPLRDRSHLDLYHSCRRLFGSRLPNARLQTLERRTLGVRRAGDLSGAECPDAYYDYLDGVDRERMERVFRHNLIDVLSLATLTAAVGDALERPTDAREAAAAGLLLSDARVKELATPHLERALAELEPERFRLDRDVRRAAFVLAREYRRVGRGRDALDVLERLAACLPGDPEPALEAAKTAERTVKDLTVAIRWAEELVARLRCASGGARLAGERDDAARRLERLRRRE